MREVGDTEALRAALEIAEADARGLVSVGRPDDNAGATQWETVMNGVRWWQGEIRRALDNRTGLVFADESAMAMIATSESEQQMPKHEAHRARASHLAGELFRRLPLLPYITLDELIDVRSQLAGPLTRFRAEMLRMGGELESEPFSSELVREVDSYIVEHVEPAVLEIDEAFTVDAYLRELRERGGGKRASTSRPEARWASR